MFEKGVTGCWLLSDGTILLEGPEGGDQQYARFYPQYDGAKMVVASEWRPVVQEISNDAITFIGTGWNGVHVFPYLWTYGIKTGDWSEQQRVYPSVAYGVKLGRDMPDLPEQISITHVAIRENTVEIGFRDNAFLGPNPYFNIKSDSAAKQLIVEAPYARIDPALSLPVSIDGTGGLVCSVRAEKGTSQNAKVGLTVAITLDSEKWEHMTYDDYTPPREDAGETPVANPKLTLFFFDDREPTDLAIKVRR